MTTFIDFETVIEAAWLNDVDAHVNNNDTTEHPAEKISNTPAGSISATDVQSAINELDTDIQNHITGAVGAHAATAISNTPAGNIAATTVQAAINELDSEKASAADLTAHINDTTDAHDASAISNVPAGNIAATDVQAAINELDTEKAALVHTHTAATIDSESALNGTVLTADGAGGANWVSAGSVSDFTWSIKTANYTAVDLDGVFADTTSSAWTLTLPATPATNTRIWIIDYAGTFATNTLTIARNGSNIMGLAEDMTVTKNYASFQLHYVDSTQGWKIR